MDEMKVKEVSTTYEVIRSPAEGIELPPEFAWLRWLTPDEQRAFFQALMDALARAWQSLNITSLSQEIERWQQRAQERRMARAEVERQAFWASHEQRLNQQRALIDELLQEITGDTGAVPSTPEIRELLGQQIPYDDRLSDEIIATRYEER
jgi:O-methyltransferase involved in polyketide biosynthesis